MLSFSALPTIGCTSIVFRAQDGTGIYARTMEWGASDLKSEWLEILFAFMQRNSSHLIAYFRLSSDAVVEIGRQIAI